jgi:hypothetical protein
MQLIVNDWSTRIGSLKPQFRKESRGKGMKLGRLTILAVCIVGFGAIASAQDGYHYSNWAYNVRPDQPLAPVLAHTIFTTNAYSMRARWVNANAWSQWVGNPAGSQFQARLRCYTNTRIRALRNVFGSMATSPRR